jgi:hypothetical protein
MQIHFTDELRIYTEYRQSNRQTGKQTDIQTDIHTDRTEQARHTVTDTLRQADKHRQTDRHTHTHTHTHKHTNPNTHTHTHTDKLVCVGASQVYRSSNKPTRQTNVFSPAQQKHSTTHPAPTQERYPILTVKVFKQVSRTRSKTIRKLSLNHRYAWFTMQQRHGNG